MDEQAAQILAELYAAAQRHDAGEPERLRRWRVLERDSGEFLAFLVRAAAARTILEIGTSRGVSTLWLADAAVATGGSVSTVDTDAVAQEAAAGSLRDAGLAAVVTFRHAEGGAVLAGTGSGTVDLLLLDAERTEYAGWWPQVHRVVAPGGLLAADNAESHAAEMAPLRDLLAADPEFSILDLSLGKGLLLAVKTGLAPDRR